MALYPAFLRRGPAAGTQDPAWDAGATWEHETYLSQRRSVRRAWLFAGLSFALAGLAILALILVLPLKEFVPYVVTVDKNTGWLEVTRGLQQGNLTQNEALAIANIVRCVNARESFDASDYPQLYRHVGLCMTDRALDGYLRQHDQGNENSPATRYGYDGILRVEISSVNLLTETTAIVSFRTILEYRGADVVNYWRAALTFGYSNKRFSMKDRFINPLGFEVSAYRRDQDLSPTQE